MQSFNLLITRLDKGCGGDANRLQTSVMTLGQKRRKLNQSFDKGRRAETEALIAAM